MLSLPYTSDPWIDPYGTLALTAGQPSPEEPLRLSEVKTHLRVDYTEDDDLILTLLTAARSQAEIMQRRVLVQRQFDLTLDYWPSYRIALAAPTISVDLVQYTDSDGTIHALTAGTGYVADLRKMPGLIATPINECWPSFTPLPSSSVLIRFTAGYGSTDLFWQNQGSRLKAGMLLLISHWYTNRLPAVVGMVTELPFAVSVCLGSGSLRRPR